MSTSWGIQIPEIGFDLKAQCWRCLKETVPAVADHIGLCDECLVSLQDVGAGD